APSCASSSVGWTGSNSGRSIPQPQTTNSKPQNLPLPFGCELSGYQQRDQQQSETDAIGDEDEGGVGAQVAQQKGDRQVPGDSRYQRGHRESRPIGLHRMEGLGQLEQSAGAGRRDRKEK